MTYTEFLFAHVLIMGLIINILLNGLRTLSAQVKAVCVWILAAFASWSLMPYLLQLILEIWPDSTWHVGGVFAIAFAAISLLIRLCFSLLLLLLPLPSGRNALTALTGMISGLLITVVQTVVADLILTMVPAWRAILTDMQLYDWLMMLADILTSWLPFSVSEAGSSAV